MARQTMAADAPRVNRDDLTCYNIASLVVLKDYHVKVVRVFLHIQQIDPDNCCPFCAIGKSHIYTSALAPIVSNISCWSLQITPMTIIGDTRY